MDTRKLATATLFGVAIAAIKAPFTFPVTDYLIIVEVPILALSFLLLGFGGATFTGLVNGILQTPIQIGFFPYVLIFAASFGVLIDVFGTLLGARSGEAVSTRRLMAALGLASMVVGITATYVFVALNLSPGINLSGYSTSKVLEVVYLPILVWGVISGVLGGFISARLWERNLRVRFRPASPSGG